MEEARKLHSICPGPLRAAAMNIARLSSPITHRCRQCSLQRYGLRRRFGRCGLAGMIALLQRTALKFSAERGCLREGEWISNFRFREPSPHSRAFGDEWRVLDPPQQLYRFAEADDRSDDTQQHGGTIEVDSEDRRIHRIYN